MDPGGGLGERVRQRRVALGLAQTELAGPGLSASYVSLIESGKRTPTGQTLQHLAARLRCSVEYLRDGLEPAAREAQALNVAWVELALSNGDVQEVLRRCSELTDAPALAADLGWRVARARAAALELQGDLEGAIAELDALREQSEATPSFGQWLNVVVALTRCYREVGDASRSIEIAQQALAEAAALGLDEESDEYAELNASLIAAYFDRGDLMHAGLLAKKLIRSVSSTGSRRAQAAAYWNASVVAEEHGKVAEALALAEKALARLAEEDQRRNMARLRLMYAGLLLRADPPDPEAAVALIEAVVPALLQSGSEVDMAYADTELARAQLMLGDPTSAIATAQVALDRLGHAPRLESAEALTVLAEGLLACGDAEAAATKARHAAQLLALQSSGRKPATAWNQLAEILMQLGELEEAVRAYRRAVAAMGVSSPQAVPAQEVT
jgi:transcriptional regulator with XRE-family HTH domain